MKLLILSNNPARASFRQRIGIYIDRLQNNGFDSAVEKIPAGSLARFQLFKKTEEFDVVFLHKKGLNPLDAFILKKFSKKIIYDFDDAIMYKPAAPQQNSSSHYTKFRRSVKIADLVIAGNNYLAEQARKFNDNVQILLTGLDTSEYNINTDKKDDKIRLVWIGSTSTLKYLKQLKPVLEEIGQENKNVILRIICDTFFNTKNIPVEKKNWSKKTQAYDLVTADIGLAPLPNNRFTRGKCGFKILQYAAAGLPVITSPVGVNKKLVKQGQTGCFAENNNQWKQNITELIKSCKTRKIMGQNNRIFAENFDINVIGEKLVELIKNS